MRLFIHFYHDIIFARAIRLIVSFSVHRRITREQQDTLAARSHARAAAAAALARGSGSRNPTYAQPQNNSTVATTTVAQELGAKQDP